MRKTQNGLIQRIETLSARFLTWLRVAHAMAPGKSSSLRKPADFRGLQSELEQYCQKPCSRDCQSRKEDGEHCFAGGTWLKRIGQPKFRIISDTRLGIFLSRHTLPMNAHSALISGITI